MKKYICLVLVTLLTLAMAGCAKEPTIVGTWEEEITVSVLGLTDQPGNHPAVLRYTFAEDGSGIQEIIPNDLPERANNVTFNYAVEGDKLILNVTSTTQGEVPFEYTIKNLTNDTLELYFYGVTNNLKRVK